MIEADTALPCSYDAQLRERVIRREVEALSHRFATANIQHLYYKGTALAYSVYSDPTDRPRTDTDVLIQPENKLVAEAILKDLSFRTLPVSGEDRIAYQRAFIKTLPWGHVVIDLHWQISNRPVFKRLIDFEVAWAEASTAPRLGLQARIFGHVDALLIAVIHPFMHHHGEQDPIWIRDQILLAQNLSPAQWDEFLKRAEERGVLRLTLSQLRRLRDNHKLTLSPCVESAINKTPRYEQSWSYRHSTLLSQTWLDLRFSSSLFELGRQLQAIAFPSPEYVLQKYGVSDSRQKYLFLPLLYLFRFGAGLSKSLMRFFR